MSQAVRDAKEQVLWGCKTMCGKGYVLGTAGNISARVAGEGYFVITPTSLPYDELRAEDLVVADMAGNIVEGSRRPSLEFSMHRGILLARPEVRAIVHTHSAYATAASALAGIAAVPIIDIETAMYIGGDIPIAPFAPPGSEELARNAAAAIGAVAGLLLEGHGAMGVGRTMREAMIASDNVERTCMMFLALKAAGAIKPLPEGYVRECCAQSRKDRGLTA